MGIFDRWRRVRADVSSESLGFEALTAEMTAQGCLIITREGVEYTVYWARNQDDPLILRTSVEAIKRSVEGKGPTALEAMLDCRAQAIRLDAVTRVS
jgi:hypothetical protein